MSTALAEKPEVTHQTTPLTVAGATVAGVGAGLGTAAVGTKIANGDLKFNNIVDFAKNGANKATDAVKGVAETAQNIDLKQTASDLKSKATDVISNAGEALKGNSKNSTGYVQLNMFDEANETSSMKDKASGVFAGLKDKVSGLKDSFNSIENPKIKAAIIAAAAIATLAVAKVTHDKLSETHVDPSRGDNVAHISQGVARGQTSELAIPASANQR